MILNEMICQIEAEFPVTTAMEWDNVGLLAGRTQKEISKIYIALDATDEVITHAKNFEADLLLTHHPMIFSARKKITTEDFIGNRLVDLLQNDISYYAMHTNYDVLRMGELAAQMLSLQNTKAVEVTSNDGETGIGKIGTLKSPMTIRELAAQIKSVFELSSVKVFGDLERNVSIAAIVPGSGKSCIQSALEQEAEVMITGDIDHHEGIDANAQGMAVIDAGHYGLEHIFIKDMKQWFEKKMPEVQVKTEKITHPFQVI